MIKEKQTLGKPKWTLGISSRFWIKAFEEGAKIRKKEQGEITLDNFELIQLAKQFKEMAQLFTLNDLEIIGCKFPQTQEFLERIYRRDIGIQEEMNIREGYKTKVNMMERLG